MKKNILKILLLTIILSAGAIWSVGTNAGTSEDIRLHLEAAAEQGAGYGEPQDPRLTVALVIRSLLGVVGIVLVVILLYAGFTWMTAGGNEEKVATARKLIINAVIGLAIVASAYALTRLLTYFALGGRENILEQQVKTIKLVD